MNKAQLIGNLGKDPEVRTMQNGDRVCSLTLATSESWKDKTTGERKEATEWHRVTIFNPRLVELGEKYLKKGAKVYIEGQIKTRKWQDQQGQDRYSTEIVLGRFDGAIEMLDRPPERSGAAATQAPAEPPAVNADRPAYDLDDEIPFN